jgi:hypothetical protein
MKIPPAGWHNSIPPKASNYLVLDWGYWIERIAYWTGEYWLVDNKRWHMDAIALWRPLPVIPPRQRKDDDQRSDL